MKPLKTFYTRILGFERIKDFIVKSLRAQMLQYFLMYYIVFDLQYIKWL